MSVRVWGCEGKRYKCVLYNFHKVHKQCPLTVIKANRNNEIPLSTQNYNHLMAYNYTKQNKKNFISKNISEDLFFVFGVVIV